MARAFQNVGLIRGATVRTNLLAAEHLAARYSATAGILGLPATYADERRLSPRAETLAEILGLSGLMDRDVDGLPYGMLKHVELAAVLATDPDLVLLDEPTSGMGPAETDAFAATLLELRRTFRLTILMIEHHVPVRVGGVRPRLLPELRRDPGRGQARRGADPSRGGPGLPRRGGRRRGCSAPRPDRAPAHRGRRTSRSATAPGTTGAPRSCGTCPSRCSKASGSCCWA